ncbi:MAG: CHAT domain-containing protein [Bacteroidota bacterium]
MSTGRPIIFLAFANEKQDNARYLRGLAQEQRGIRKALQSAHLMQAAEIVERSNCTLSDIVDVFQDPIYQGRIAVFHYAGHAESYSLLLEDENEHQQIVHSEGFVCFLANQTSLKFVFLNGCSTGPQAKELQEAGIPHVVATSQAINDDIAQKFAIRLYKGLAGYATLEKAFEDARSEIVSLTGAGGFRSLYWEEEENPPDSYPWQLLSERQGNWQLLRSATQLNTEIGELKIGRFAHVFCDRSPQNDDFASTHVDGRGIEPQIYLIAGHREERHESLIKRFSYQYVGKRESYNSPFEVQNWPFKGKVENLLKVRLAEQFPGLNQTGKPIGKLSGEDLISHLSLSGREAIVIQHNIPGEYWNKTTADLIEWYIDTFWEVEAIPPDAPPLIIFINIFFSDELNKSGGFTSFLSSKYTRKKILKEVQKVVEKAKGSVYFLDELEHVRKTDVKDWLMATNLAELNELGDLPAEIFEVEGEQREALFMSIVESKLKSTVEFVKKKYSINEM